MRTARLTHGIITVGINPVLGVFDGYLSIYIFQWWRVHASPFRITLVYFGFILLAQT
jgi:hypothetical protein